MWWAPLQICCCVLVCVREHGVNLLKRLKSVDDFLNFNTKAPSAFICDVFFRGLRCNQVPYLYINICIYTYKIYSEKNITISIKQIYCWNYAYCVQTCFSYICCKWTENGIMHSSFSFVSKKGQVEIKCWSFSTQDRRLFSLTNDRTVFQQCFVLWHWFFTQHFQQYL